MSKLMSGVVLIVQVLLFRLTSSFIILCACWLSFGDSEFIFLLCSFVLFFYFKKRTNKLFILAQNHWVLSIKKLICYLTTWKCSAKPTLENHRSKCSFVRSHAHACMLLCNFDQDLCSY